MTQKDKKDKAEQRLLIVAPQPALRQVLGDFLSNFFHLSLASSSDDALHRLGKQKIDLLLLDDTLKRARELIRHTQMTYDQMPIIVLSGEKRSKEEIIGVGNCSFLGRGRIGNEVGRAQLLLLCERRIREAAASRETIFRRRLRNPQSDDGIALVGESDSTQRLREQIVEAADSNLNLLITGETGVGKTLVAESVHYATKVTARPFVTLDPSTVAPTLFESELFGHARGAYTGATAAQIGAFEAAEGGTLLLDEIGDLQVDLQRKLLQAVETGVIRRVGDVREIFLNVRIIAATNRSLEADISGGQFRADLFQRLNELRLHIPPLRERADDVVPILRHFLQQYRPGLELGVSSTAEMMLRDYHWPGNVRELRTLARRLGTGEQLGDELDEEKILRVLPARLDRGDESDLSLEERIHVFSRRTYLEALRGNDYSIRGTARALEVPYHTLRSRLKSLELLKIVQQERHRS